MKYLIVAVFGLFTFFSCTKIDDPAGVDPLPANFPKIIFKSGTSEVNVTFQGVARRFVISVPENYSDKNTYPIVFALKPNLGTEDKWIRELTPFIESREYIGIYPESKDGKWKLGVDESTPNEDIEFVSAIIAAAKATGNVDANKIFAMGISNGGCMAYYLGIKTNHFAGIVSIAGSVYEGMGTSPLSPVSVLQIHGELDQSVPFNGGSAHGYEFYSAYNSAATWAQFNGCSDDPTIDNSINGAVIYNFNQCDAGLETILFSVPQSGHSVYSDFNTINLTGYIFDFFGRHSK